MKTLLTLFALLTLFSLMGQTSILSNVTHVFDIQEDKITESVPQLQLFNISFSDSLMVHSVFNPEREIQDSQVYRISSFKENDNLITFTALSGVSRRSYVYMLKTDEDFMSLMQYFQDEQTLRIFEGPNAPLKTFNQP
ncbi:MAG: hypothetical protein FJZ80_09635 [Bacteroidetes bacterium]|nr:hypothetical protein [Bacteroidota bacterium]